MNVELTVRKLNAIILKMAEADVVGRKTLKSKFCSELAKLLEEFEASNSVASKSVAEKYLADVTEGNYFKAVECLEDLEGMNKNHFF